MLITFTRIFPANKPFLPPPLDFEQGGLYTATQVREMDLFSQTPRRIQDLNMGLSAQGTRRADGHIGPHELFPELPDLNYKTSLVARFWTWLDRWGSVMSVVVGLGVLFKFATWVAGLVIRLFAIHRDHGISLALLTAFFPSAWLVRWPTRRRPMRPVRQGDEEDDGNPSAPRNFEEEEAMLQQRMHELQRDRQIAVNRG